MSLQFSQVVPEATAAVSAAMRVRPSKKGGWVACSGLASLPGTGEAMAVALRPWLFLRLRKGREFSPLQPWSCSPVTCHAGH